MLSSVLVFALALQGQSWYPLWTCFTLVGKLQSFKPGSAPPVHYSLCDPGQDTPLSGPPFFPLYNRRLSRSLPYGVAVSICISYWLQVSNKLPPN